MKVETYAVCKDYLFEGNNNCISVIVSEIIMYFQKYCGFESLTFRSLGIMLPITSLDGKLFCLQFSEKECESINPLINPIWRHYTSFRMLMMGKFALFFNFE